MLARGFASVMLPSKALQGGVMSLGIDVNGLLSQKMGPRLDAMRMGVGRVGGTILARQLGDRIGQANHGSLRPQPAIDMARAHGQLASPLSTCQVPPRHPCTAA